MTLSRRILAAIRYFRAIGQPSPRRKLPDSRRVETTIDLLGTVPENRRIALQAKLFGTHTAVANALGVAE